MKIWKWKPIVGDWFVCQDVPESSMMAYLKIFREDEPNCYFVAQDRKPRWSVKRLICECGAREEKHEFGNNCPNTGGIQQIFKAIPDGFSYKK